MIMRLIQRNLSIVINTHWRGKYISAVVEDVTRIQDQKVLKNDSNESFMVMWNGKKIIITIDINTIIWL